MSRELIVQVRTVFNGFVRRTAQLESMNRLALTMLFRETTARRCDLTPCLRLALLPGPLVDVTSGLFPAGRIAALCAGRVGGV